MGSIARSHEITSDVLPLFFLQPQASSERVSCAVVEAKITEGIGPTVSLAAELLAICVDTDFFAPSAALPFCDSARLRSSAAARAECGVAVLFIITLLIFLSFPIHPNTNLTKAICWIESFKPT
jgi:hypothetical protein